ncbi:hypothetical protein NXC12_CH01803 [Rhizobium etli]|uniref:Uncharacterized protein n=1 Tax=Rhizobium etli TaxID=29449 RepID=A0AAN1BF79_RHIET|nr:hypothetical protein [Rhizobium etli]ARQ09846.1 hypothetical protein NXC12_CH01803 [Rhizobium etli]
MATNSIPDRAKLPDRSKPPVTMGNSREAGEGLTDADPKTRRADQKERIPSPQFSNRK